MQKKANGVNYSKQKAAVERRIRVIIRLENQLKSGVKAAKEVGFEPLEAKDITRINKELEILKQRL